MSDDSNAPWELDEIITCFKPESATFINNHPRLKDLKATLLRKVAKVSIEFLKTNGIKPHVVFNLAILPQNDPRLIASYGESTHQAVRVSMEWHGYDDENTGTFEIDPLPYKESSRSAHGAFDFPLLKKNLTVWDWCRIFKGEYPGLPDQHKGDLTKFRFVVTSSDLMDGCRDFICQCFVRLYESKVVQCHGGGIGVSGKFENFELLNRHPELVQRPEHSEDFWFFDVIDKNYAKNAKIKITPMPMHRGIFLDRNVGRTEWFQVNAQHRFRLNYVNNGPGGSDGGPPGHGGNGGGRGPGGPPGNGGKGGPGNGGNGGGRGPGGPGGQPPAGDPSTGGGQGGVGTSRSAGGIPGGNQLGTGSVARRPPGAAERKPAPVTTDIKPNGKGLVSRPKPASTVTTAAHGPADTPANARAAPTGTGVKRETTAKRDPTATTGTRAPATVSTDAQIAAKKPPPASAVGPRETVVKKPPPPPAARPQETKPQTKKRTA